MWTVIGIFLVLVFIGNLIKKKETPVEKKAPPTKTGSRAPAPLADVEQHKTDTLQVDPVRPAARRLTFGSILADKTPGSLIADGNNAAPCITMTEALNLIMHIDGFKEYMLTRYAMTGLTHLAPAYMSDLHDDFMRLITHKPFYAIQQFNWARAIDFSSVRRRNIASLYHFSHLSNLRGIFKSGIISRRKLEEGNHAFHYNDELRLEGIRDSISLSLGQVNKKMLYKYTQGLRDRDWVILKIKKELISGPTQPSFDHRTLLRRAVFCHSNAASSAVKAISVEQRQKHQAFQAMFCGENNEDSGDSPHDIQAEILYLGEIPTWFISDVIFYSADIIPPWLRDCPVNIVVDPSHFAFR
ncbi:DarT ssDNA thymidine ADP-ribosyltransferase family protein [Klebsiella sp. I138]|uniref:DarT ssDNA thymidine ADP-ribosyltransferase family protein n=1 Tax=Klebsiella sp. I138 TaxID=2755385 RepID=UPI003DA90417